MDLHKQNFPSIQYSGSPETARPFSVFFMEKPYGSYCTLIFQAIEHIDSMSGPLLLVDFILFFAFLLD